MVQPARFLCWPASASATPPPSNPRLPRSQSCYHSPLVYFPTGEWLISEPNPEFAAAFPLGEVWRKGLANIIAHNAGCSVTSPAGTMFDHTMFAVDQFFIMPIAKSALTAFTMIPPTSPQYAGMLAVMDGAFRAAWLQKSEILLPAPAAGTVMDGQNSPTTHGGIMGAGARAGDHWTTADGMANLLAETMRVMAGHTMTTLSERDHKKAAADTVIKYSLCFARLVPPTDGFGPVEVVPAAIRPKFKEMLETTKTSQATSLMLLETHTRRAAGSPLFLKASVTLTDGNWVDGETTACLRDFRLIDKTLAVTPAKVKVNVGPITCVTLTATSIVLQQRRNADQRLLIQEAVDEAPAKMDKKSTELFVGGSYHSAVAATNAFANWHLLGEIISPEYGQSEMKKALTIG
jgi:hypothetical protein